MPRGMHIPRMRPSVLLDAELEDRSGELTTPLLTTVRDESPKGMLLIELSLKRSLREFIWLLAYDEPGSDPGAAPPSNITEPSLTLNTVIALVSVLRILVVSISINAK